MPDSPISLLSAIVFVAGFSLYLSISGVLKLRKIRNEYADIFKSQSKMIKDVMEEYGHVVSNNIDLKDANRKLHIENQRLKEQIKQLEA